MAGSRLKAERKSAHLRRTLARHATRIELAEPTAFFVASAERESVTFGRKTSAKQAKIQQKADEIRPGRLEPSDSKGLFVDSFLYWYA